MTSVAPLGRLLTALREHEIPLSRDDVEWAFKSPSTREEVEEWVVQFLGPETLLSKEEAELYLNLKNKGLLQELSSSHDIDTVHPTRDDELRTAIAALETSTVHINKQTETLKAQIDALNSIVSHDRDEAIGRKRIADRRLKKHVSEKQHLDILVEELSQSIRSQLATSQKQIESSHVTLQPTILEVLGKDDRILGELERLASKGIAPEDPRETAAAVEHLCKKLATLKVQAVQCRLDYIYLKGEHNVEMVADSQSTNAGDELLSLQEELDSLYSEIGVVAEMSVQQQFQEPIVRSITERKNEATAQFAQVLEHVSATIAQLTVKLEAVTAQIEEHRSYTVALREVSKAAEAELRDPVSPQGLSCNQSSRSTLNPGEESSTDTYMRPPKLTPDQMAEPQWQLLKSLAISKPIVSGRDGIDKALSAELIERRKKLAGSVVGFESTIASALGEYIGDADRALQLLLETLLVDTRYHEVHLADTSTEAEIDSLSHQISDLGIGIGELDLDDLHMPNKKKEHFTQRWSD